MAAENTQLIEDLKNALGTLAERIVWSINMPVINLSAANLESVVSILKENLQFDMFTDVTAVDWLGTSPAAERFEVVYHFYSTKTFHRVRVKTRVSEDNPAVPTMRPMFESAFFMERECHDMYGIKFEGNDDLRPILLYEGFQGHPLRKDYSKTKEQPLVEFRSNYGIVNR